jgi:hypothetical protein
MFRCDNCGSGYSMRAASSWESCPRCLAKDRLNVPLTFELGWRGQDRLEERPTRGPEMELADSAPLPSRPLG